MGCATTKSKDISPEIPTRGKVWTDNDRASSSTKYLCRSNSSIQGGPESQRPNENKTGHHWSQAAVCSLTEFEASAARQSPTTDADATTTGTTKKEDETGTSSSNTDGEQEPCVRFHVQAVSPVAVLDHADPLIASTVGDGDQDRLSETSPDASQITEEVNEQKQWANNQAFLDKSVFRKSRSLSLKTSNVEQSRQLMTSLARPKALFYDTPLTSEEQAVQFRKLYLVDVGQHSDSGDMVRISTVLNGSESHRSSLPLLPSQHSALRCDVEDDVRARYSGHKARLQARYPNSATTEQIYRYFYEERFEGDMFHFQRQLEKSQTLSDLRSPACKNMCTFRCGPNTRLSEASSLESLAESDET